MFADLFETLRPLQEQRVPLSMLTALQQHYIDAQVAQPYGNLHA